MLREDFTKNYPPAASELNYTNKVVNILEGKVANLPTPPRIETDPDGTPVLVFGE